MYFVNARTVQMIVEIHGKATPSDCNDFCTLQLSKFCIANQCSGWNELVLKIGLTRRPINVIIMATTTSTVHIYGYWACEKVNQQCNTSPPLYFSYFADACTAWIMPTYLIPILYFQIRLHKITACPQNGDRKETVQFFLTYSTDYQLCYTQLCLRVTGQLSGRMLAQRLRSLRFKSLPRHPVVKVNSSLTSSSCCSYQHHPTEAR